MRTIFKYTFSEPGEVTVALPQSAQVVLVGTQDAKYCIWLEFDQNIERLVNRTFVIRGTGHQVEDGLVHVGSFIAAPFVWHVYEVVKR